MSSQVNLGFGLISVGCASGSGIIFSVQFRFKSFSGRVQVGFRSTISRSNSGSSQHQFRLESVSDSHSVEDAANVGVEKWDMKQIKEAVVGGGGGWHGRGWLGSGR
ncbi:hypothetical protein F3Y22_tig00111881pilonHSYRG00087 [Hibiscus syriacus]|uniref:Uncharacterized protein n=1 Tax=Hibiscus syriacus TaxID=106335 RepID=A0A6A2X9C1_HIBSY|nr:hypothetical protein F3Y22_tig00111881pilonHSYRG00087 [Hibiscus syriacus]